MEATERGYGKLFAAILLVAIILAAALGYIAGNSSNIRTETTTSTSVSFKTSYVAIGNVTTSEATGIPPGGLYSNEVIAPTKGVDLTGCSISSDTCTFLITNIDEPSDIGITLASGQDCVDLNYGTPNAGSEDGATSCTSSPSYYISSITTSFTYTNFTAIFPPFGGLKAPVIGQLVYGCIGYTTEASNGTDYGCLAFLGTFTQ